LLKSIESILRDKAVLMGLFLSMRFLQAVQEARPVRVVLFGDSISEVGRSKTWNGGASAPEKNWGTLLKSKLESAVPGCSILISHYGIGGQNTYEGLGRLDGLENFQPDLVLVAFGANDCCHHFLIPEETHLALKTMLAEITNRFGADVLVVGTAGDNPDKPFFRHLEATIEVQKKAAEEFGCPFVDARSAMLAATAHGARWGDFHLADDNCHPNDQGHEIWADAVFKSLVTAKKNLVRYLKLTQNN
jgi:lysophospholipase L1-like esterase